MTQQIINIGSAPNDGTGDAVRSSFDKCNLNFTELYQGVAKGVSIGSAIEYQFNNTTTEPPASGQIRFNQATQASTTKLWASHTTSSGINIKQFLSAATTGAKLILQDENDNTNYIKFDVTGVPVDKTTYWEFAVAVTASGGNLPNAAILAAVTGAASSVGAAPFDALAYNGMQINGSMEVSQEKGANSPVVSGYICDGWKLFKIGSMVISASQNPFGALSTPYYTNMSISTAQPSLGSSDAALLIHYIERWRVIRLGWGASVAIPITIGFWTAHHRTGIYTVSVHNPTTNRSYIATYTQNAADSWQYNTITISGDIAGAWYAAENGVGLGVYFVLAAGSSAVSSTLNTWLAGDFYGASSQVNAVAATSDVFRITGVVVLPGTQAPTAAQSPFIMRPYVQELVTCQRYYQKFVYPEAFISMSGYGTAGAAPQFTFTTPVEMRAAPTAATVPALAWSVNNVTSITPLLPTPKTFSLYLAITATNNFNANNSGTAGAGITLDARL